MLFDGSSKAGWEMTGPGELALENGELETHGGMGMLWYAREEFGNCQIKVVFTMTRDDDNSGVFIRIPGRPVDPWYAVNKGYEVQIYNHGDDFHRMGCLYSLTKAKARVSAPVGRWSTYIITLDGPRTVVELNGSVITDYVEGSPVPERLEEYEPERGPRPEAGYIGLQNHGDPARVRFKEVSVRPLE